MLETPNSHKLLLSLLSDKVTLFYTFYIIDLKNNLWENHVTICSKQKRRPNKKKEKYSTSKDLPSDHGSLGMKIIWVSFASHCMLNCLNSCYVPLDPSRNWWKFLENWLGPIWFMGIHLPNPDVSDVVDLWKLNLGNLKKWKWGRGTYWQLWVCWFVPWLQ